MDQAIRNSASVGMTDQDHETAIESARQNLLRAYESGDLDTARAWARNVAHLVAQRSDEVVWKMEKELGLR